MSSFVGDYACKADSKYRVVVPASFRKVMQASGQVFFVVKKNIFGKCIDLFPMQEWERRMGEVQAKLNPFNPRHVDFLREFCRGTQEVEMDTSGRVLLPRRLLEEVGINKEMVLAAQDSMIQIWDTEAYARVAMGGEELSALAEEIFKG